jgi:hypothetical protein
MLTSNKDGRKLRWEQIESARGHVFRSKVPGGWLVILEYGSSSPSIVFYPDPDHAWDGSSLE